MKYIFSPFMLVLGLALLLSSVGCDQNHNIPPIGDPASKLEGIHGSFTLSEVVQVDELTQIAENKLMDISDFFVGQNPAMITFDANNFSYSYSNGDAPINFFGDAGVWEFFNPEFPDKSNEFPEQIILSPDGEGDITLEMLKTIRPVDQNLEIKISRECAGDPSVGYRFIFSRQ